MSERTTDHTTHVILDQLRENTGTHFLDSGCAYGRHWQRNEHRDFQAEPEVRGRFERYRDGEWYVSPALSVFHFLAAFCEHDEDMQADFDTFAERPEHEDDCWLAVMEAWGNHLTDTRGATGLYGDGRPATENTYNSENLLDQVLQFLYFEIDGDGYIALQVHGGCDVRGGYTAPKVYRLNAYDNAAFFCAMHDVQLGCENGHSWYSDDSGSHWYASNGEADLSGCTADDLHIDDDGHGHCPECGSPLELSVCLGC